MGPPYPKTGSGALPKTLVRPMSAVEGASWTGIAMATSGSFHQPRLSRAIHPASQARLSNVPILHLIASARARTASQALRFKVPGQQAKHPNPPLHPSLPSLAVVAIPLSSSYPPLPVSRRPLPPPWRPTTASLARCMFSPFRRHLLPRGLARVSWLTISKHPRHPLPRCAPRIRRLARPPS